MQDATVPPDHQDQWDQLDQLVTLVQRESLVRMDTTVFQDLMVPQVQWD